MPTINKLAILSGTLGATASLIAKLALSPTSPIPTFVDTTCINFINADATPEDGFSTIDFIYFSADICSLAALASRGICLLFMITLNAVMISSFLDGMNESGSVAGTSLATAANFSCSVSCNNVDTAVIDWCYVCVALVHYWLMQLLLFLRCI